MLIFFTATVSKMEFYQLLLPEEKIKELSEYSKRKEEISIDLNEEKIIFGNSEIKFELILLRKNVY